MACSATAENIASLDVVSKLSCGLLICAPPSVLRVCPHLYQVGDKACMQGLVIYTSCYCPFL